MTREIASTAPLWRGARARRRPALVAAGLAAVLLACVWILESRFQGLSVTQTRIAGAPVTLYRLDPRPRAPVIVAHGFGGSRQMMDQIAVSLARQGFFVASVDLPGHGRSGLRLSPDVTRIEGTTAQLVAAVARVTEAVAARDDTAGPVSFVGHSMATDVVIRAAAARGDVGAVAALSMYSPAVTETAPAALLMLSGAAEAHLRDAALEAARLVAPEAGEGQTVAAEGVIRRVAVAPWVGHVGVLYAPVSLAEVTGWLRQVTGQGAPAPLDRSGWVPAVLLAALTLLAWPVAQALPARAGAAPALRRGPFWLCLTLPVPLALAPALAPVFGIAGAAGFGTLAAILGLWGLTQLALLWRAGLRPGRPDLAATLAYLAWGAVFALALDRFGAAFLPGGDRAAVMAGLCLATLPLMAADGLLTAAAPLWRRLVARAALLATLAGAMALAPTELGLAFTTLPVLVLFFGVYGSAARWIAVRRGPGAAALGSALALAWAIAASTPLFAVGPLG